ncbi:MAG: MBL fold metallo-hydrolase [Rhodobacteraceae bacterium]|nr:MBL fold metallo-hydrolase [Paracoccaceae bacterium]
MTRIARKAFGDFDITVMRDGGLEFGNEVFPALAEERISAILAESGKRAIETNFNAVLLRSPDSCILIDAGAREHFGPGAGQFPQAMAEAGLSAHDVETLVITHLHPDHIGGTTNPDNSAVFPNAEFVLTEAEYNFWTADGNFTNVDDAKLQWRNIALAVLEAYSDRIRTVASNGPIAPGVTFSDLPGHTPGHAGVLLDSGGARFLHAADILHAPDLQLFDPDIGAVFDMDKEEAIRSRRRGLDMIADDRMLFTGSHFLNCQLGYLETSGRGYRISQD